MSARLVACYVALSVLVERSAAIAAELMPAMQARRPIPPLRDFLQALPGGDEAQLFYGLMIAGTAGMIAHYMLKWARGEIRENVFCYVWANFRSSCLSLFSYVGVAVTAISSGALYVEDPITHISFFVGWKLVFWMGWTNGFTIDAIVNKTKRAEWSVPERTAKTGGST